MERIKNTVNKNAMLFIVLLIVLLFEVLFQVSGKGSLLQPNNLSNLISQNGYVVILATGMLLCILTGGNIDLSVGSMVVLIGAITGFLIMNLKMNIYLSILLTLAFGTALGAWQAFWIAYLRVPPFIVTLAGMLTFRGLALVLINAFSGGMSIGPFSSSFTDIFNSYLPSLFFKERPPQNTILFWSVLIAAFVCVILIFQAIFSRINKKRKGYAIDGILWTIIRLAIICAVIMFIFYKLGRHNGIPVLLVIIGVVVLAYNFYTQNTVPGRYLYALGGNAKAARMSGINTKRAMFFAYTNMGFLAGLASLVVVARFNQASTTAGTGYEMDAIASCFIGGASAYGGIGKVGGAVIGAIFMGVLNMGMSILGADPNLQKVIKGLVLLSAAAFDVLSKNRKQAA